MMGLGKPKMHTKFEVFNFIYDDRKTLKIWDQLK